jgi:hypothetical protein
MFYTFIVLFEKSSTLIDLMDLCKDFIKRRKVKEEGSSPRPAPVGLPVLGEHDFSSTTTSHPAEMSACV